MVGKARMPRREIELHMLREAPGRPVERIGPTVWIEEARPSTRMWPLTERIRAGSSGGSWWRALVSDGENAMKASHTRCIQGERAGAAGSHLARRPRTSGDAGALPLELRPLGEPLH